MRRDDLYLVELVEATRTVSRYLSGVGAERWASDDVLRDAVLHRVMLIGEMARSVSEEVRGRHPRIPWAEIRAFRNRAVHEYFSVEWGRVLEIASADVPALEPLVLAVLRQEYPEVARQPEERENAEHLRPGRVKIAARAPMMGR